MDYVPTNLGPQIIANEHTCRPLFCFVALERSARGSILTPPPPLVQIFVVLNQHFAATATGLDNGGALSAVRAQCNYLGV